MHLYSTFATSSKVLCTKSNKLGVAFYYLNALNAAEEDTWKGTGRNNQQNSGYIQNSGEGLIYLGEDYSNQRVRVYSKKCGIYVLLFSNI